MCARIRLCSYPSFLRVMHLYIPCCWFAIDKTTQNGYSCHTGLTISLFNYWICSSLSSFVWCVVLVVACLKRAIHLRIPCTQSTKLNSSSEHVEETIGWGIREQSDYKSIQLMFSILRVITIFCLLQALPSTWFLLINVLETEEIDR